MNNHFFIDAPVMQWHHWIQRRLLGGEPQDPSFLPSKLSTTELPVSPTGVPPKRAVPECAKEYSTFLATHFYPHSSPIQLSIPVCIFESGIKYGHVQGVEIRTSTSELVGVIFCLYAGLYSKEESIGLITWHCVHPTWRKKGIPNCLLRSIHVFTQPRKVYMFRNDGWLRSPLPPIWTDQRIQRKKSKQRVNKIPYSIQRVPYGIWQHKIKEDWKTQNPTGFIFDDSKFKYRSMEIWEMNLGKDVYCIVALQPTFECQRSSNDEQWCEIVSWLFVGTQKTPYEQAMYIEYVLDTTPYTWFDAPSKMPHIETRWTAGGSSSWMSFGIDPGTPVLRPILSLCFV